jgi:N-acetylmuramoyl-L-alanine amidase
MQSFGLSQAARRRGVVYAAVAAAIVAPMCAWPLAAQHAKAGAWQQAVEARAAFEAEPADTHSKAEYAAVMDRFRAIYHANAGDTYAARSVQQVAELLAEQGRELGDAKATKDARGQYEFLAKAYPGYAHRAQAAEAALDSDNAMPQAQEAVASNGAPETTSNTSPHKPGRRSVADEIAAARAQDATPDDAATIAAQPVRTKARADRSVSPADTDALQVLDDAAGAAGVVNTASPVSAAEANGGHRQLAQVAAIRHWSTPTYSRVVIDLGDAVEYQAARVEHPDRIYFDLHHARLAQGLVGKSFAVTDDGFLTKIRAAQFTNDVTRVVLDVHEVGEYSAFLLPNPYRLIIDIHGKAASNEAATTARNDGAAVARMDVAPARMEAGAASNAKVETASPAVSQASSATPRQGAEVSALPPMPVTDAAAAFGLPKKNSVSTQAAAQPRVVIPQKPTAAKPVPNSVSSRVTDTGVDVAAVSRQQGRVVATAAPTSQPIAERSSEAKPAGTSQDVSSPTTKRSARGKRSATAAQTHVAGEPAEAAPPTADGETSLVRALGLKIGRIVIDAGHGGHDSGTLGVGGIEEKDVVLDVALRLGKLLHDRLGAEVVYTRADDTFIPLETRTAIANKAQADLFLSIHANSSSDSSARGVEVYYLNFTSDPEAMKVAGRENAVSTQSVHELSDLVKKIALKDKIDESKELATDVDAALYQGITKGNPGLKNRGVKKAPFVVLIGANMPSILAEISFVTNAEDASELERPAYRERVAESLYNGVAQYAGGINGKKSTRTLERAAVQ